MKLSEQSTNIKMNLDDKNSSRHEHNEIQREMLCENILAIEVLRMKHHAIIKLRHMETHSGNRKKYM